MLQRYATTLVFSFITLVYFAALLSFGGWREAATKIDGWGYHAYLPALFWDNDLGKMQRLIDLRRKTDLYNPYDSTNTLHPYNEYTPAPKTGNFVLKYTMGVALMQAPFWAFAHIIAKIGGFAATDEGSIYHFSLCFAVIFYIIMGFYVLKRFLERYFTQKTVLTTLLCLAFCTNLFEFGVSGNIMAHGIQFFWVALLLFYTDEWHRSPSLRKALAVGFILGIITLIRPNELLFGLIPLFWGVYDKVSLGAKLQLWRENWRQLLCAAVCVPLPFLPQIAYWKIIAGVWFFDSYPNEHFDFAHPHIIGGFFTGENALFFYSPALFLAFLGVFIQKKYAPQAFFTTIIVVLVFTYITYSWWCWDYSGAYGSRPIVDLLPVLSLPFAAFWERVWAIKTLRFALFLAVFFVGIQTIQLERQNTCRYIHTATSAIYYKNLLFLKRIWTENDIIALQTKINQPENLRYKSTCIVRYADSILPIQNEYTGDIALNFAAANLQPNTWLRVSVSAMAHEEIKNAYRRSLLVAECSDNGRQHFWAAVSIDDKLGSDPNNRQLSDVGRLNTWGEAHFFVRVPPSFSNNATLKLVVWDIGRHKNIVIKNLKIAVFE
jgi:hypothetical protein